jgi:quinol monooxygenase YgiN
VIYVVATLTVKPETRAEFIAAATACINETRNEPGNIAYDMHESVTDPTKMVFVEQWESVEATLPHRSAEHMKPSVGSPLNACRRLRGSRSSRPQKSTFGSQEQQRETNR